MVTTCGDRCRHAGTADGGPPGARVFQSYGSAPTALDRCVPPPIRPRARWCRACVPILQQLPEIRHSDSHRSANTSIAYEWYSSCFDSSCHQVSTAQVTGKRHDDMHDCTAG